MELEEGVAARLSMSLDDLICQDTSQVDSGKSAPTMPQTRYAPNRGAQQQQRGGFNGIQSARRNPPNPPMNRNQNNVYTSNIPVPPVYPNPPAPPAPQSAPPPPSPAFKLTGPKNPQPPQGYTGGVPPQGPAVRFTGKRARAESHDSHGPHRVLPHANYSQTPYPTSNRFNEPPVPPPRAIQSNTNYSKAYNPLPPPPTSSNYTQLAPRQNIPPAPRPVVTANRNVNTNSPYGYNNRPPYPPKAELFSNAPQPPVEHTVIVTNVPKNLAAQEIQEAFSCVGQILRTDIMLNSKGEHTGRISITFNNADAVRAAVAQFDEGDLNGHTIRVFAE